VHVRKLLFLSFFNITGKPTDIYPLNYSLNADMGNRLLGLNGNLQAGYRKIEG